MVVMNLCKEDADNRLTVKDYQGFIVVRKDVVIDVVYRYRPSAEDLNPCDGSQPAEKTELEAAQQQSFTNQVVVSVPSAKPRLLELLCPLKDPSPTTCLASVLTPSLASHAVVY